MNFEPFLDWDAMTYEMALDLYEAMTKAQDAARAFSKVEVEDEGNLVAQGRVVVETQKEVGEILEAICSTIWTHPVMVHVAGPKKNELHPDDPMVEGVLQRCKRCGSVLSFWHEGMRAITQEGFREIGEDDVPWWEDEAVVAKANSVGMYEIEKERELEKHEMQCVSLTELSSQND